MFVCKCIKSSVCMWYIDLLHVVLGLHHIYLVVDTRYSHFEFNPSNQIYIETNTLLQMDICFSLKSKHYFHWQWYFVVTCLSVPRVIVFSINIHFISRRIAVMCSEHREMPFIGYILKLPLFRKKKKLCGYILNRLTSGRTTVFHRISFQTGHANSWLWLQDIMPT